MKKRISFLVAFATFMAVILLSCSQEASKTALAPEEAISLFLDRTYGKHDEVRNARIVRASSVCVGTPDGETDCNPFRDGPDEHKSDYFMKIKRMDRIGNSSYSPNESASQSGDTYYVLVTGVGEHACHACTGMFGAFVFEWRSGELKITASTPHLVHGSSGQPAHTWELIELNAVGYRGWRARHGPDQWGGHLTGWDTIYAPHDGKIVPLLTLGTSYLYSGPRHENRPDGNAFPEETDLITELYPDTSDESVAVYPMKAIIKGKLKGKQLRPKTFLIPFDEKEWKYRPSEEYETFAKQG